MSGCHEDTINASRRALEKTPAFIHSAIGPKEVKYKRLDLISLELRHQALVHSFCRSNREESMNKIELPQGTLDLLILKALALGPEHGWAISERIQQISRDALKIGQGSLYPSLHRLE